MKVQLIPKRQRMLLLQIKGLQRRTSTRTDLVGLHWLNHVGVTRGGMHSRVLLN